MVSGSSQAGPRASQGIEAPKPANKGRRSSGPNLHTGRRDEYSYAAKVNQPKVLSERCGKLRDPGVKNLKAMTGASDALRALSAFQSRSPRRGATPPAKSFPGAGMQEVPERFPNAEPTQRANNQPTAGTNQLCQA
jgi:hypothetical protein